MRSVPAEKDIPGFDDPPHLPLISAVISSTVAAIQRIQRKVCIPAV